jgi:predicted nucleic acid-binding protein
VNLFSGVLDTEMVIGLAKGGVFHLLSSLCAPLYVPSAVAQEVMRGGPGRAGVSELTQALGVWIIEVTADPQVVAQFSAPRSHADRAVLAVAQEQAPLDYVLSGDKQLCQIATARGFACLRTTDVVVLLKAVGLLPEVKAVLDRMQHHGYGISADRYEQALRAAGEWPAP